MRVIVMLIADKRPEFSSSEVAKTNEVFVVILHVKRKHHTVLVE